MFSAGKWDESLTRFFFMAGSGNSWENWLGYICEMSFVNTFSQRFFFFIQWNVLCLVPQSCPTLCDPRDCSPPGSSVHGNSPSKNTGVGSNNLLYSILKWVAISSSKGSSWIRKWTCISNISCAGRYILYQWCHLGSPINVNHIKIIYQIILKEEWMNNQSLTISSVQSTHSVMSDSLQPHGQQHTSFPVHHQLPELAKTHVLWVSDAIQPSHPLSSPSPPAFNLAQHQSLFKWVSSSHHVAKVLEFQQNSLSLDNS